MRRPMEFRCCVCLCFLDVVRDDEGNISSASDVEFRLQIENSLLLFASGHFLVLNGKITFAGEVWVTSSIPR